MINITFLLETRKTNSKGTAPIVLQCTWSGQRFRSGTGMTVLPEVWDNKKQRIKGADQIATLWNETLNNQRNAILLAYSQHLASNTPFTKDNIREALDGIVNKDKGSSLTLYTLHDDFLKSQSQRLTQGTLNKYRQALPFMAHIVPGLALSSITKSNVEKFITFQIKSNLSNSSIAKNLQRIKTLLKYARDYGHPIDGAVLSLTHQVDEQDCIWLSPDELDKIRNVAGLHPHLMHIKALFLFHCCIGVRQSDLAQITNDHIRTISGSPCIVLTQRKTRRPVTIPMTNEAIELWKIAQHHNTISQQNYNAYLKSLGKAAGIDEPITVRKYVGTEVQVKTVPKYTQIRTHTARHTFAVHALSRGVRPEVLKKIMGHKDINMTLKYAKIADVEYITDMLNAFN